LSGLICKIVGKKRLSCLYTIVKSKAAIFISGLTKELRNAHFFPIFSFFLAIYLYITICLCKLPNTYSYNGKYMSVPNALPAVGFPFAISLKQFSILISIQFLVSCIICKNEKKNVNILLILFNALLRFLFSMHLPPSLTDIYRNEVYGELSLRGYNPYVTYLDPTIPFLKEYEASGLPALWSNFPYVYPTFALGFFSFFCLLFPGYGYCQETFLLFALSIFDIFAAVLISKIHIDATYKYAVMYVYFSPALLMALEGQFESLANFLLVLSYFFLTQRMEVRSAITLALSVQTKFFPIALLPKVVQDTRHRKKYLSVFLLFTSSMAIPYFISPEYFWYFRTMIFGNVSSYFPWLSMLAWAFVAIGILATITKKNLLYFSISIIFGVLCLSGWVMPWHSLWLMPTIFFLIRNDEDFSMTLIFYLFVTFLYVYLQIA